MQTFLAESNFMSSAYILDNKRLGKQRIEAFQILRTLDDTWAWSVSTPSEVSQATELVSDPFLPQFTDYNKVLEQLKVEKHFHNRGWKNHPAVLMWKGFEGSLRLYYSFVTEAWASRGYSNNMPFYDASVHAVFTDFTMPGWITYELMMTHRCKLLQKDYDFYSQYGWQVPDNWREIDYYWPVKKA